MNQIFRVIYSKTKHTFVVASELAKGHSRSRTGETPSGAALVVALLLTGGALLAGSGPSWAAGPTNTHGIQFGSATVTGGESNVAGGYHDAYDTDDDYGIVEKKGVTGDSVSGGYYITRPMVAGHLSPAVSLMSPKAIIPPSLEVPAIRPGESILPSAVAP